MALAIDIMLNGACNLECPFCYGPDPKDERQLGLSDLEALGIFVRSRGVSGTVLSGGEPTLRADLPDVLRLFVGLDLWVGLQSNGTRPHVIKSVLHYLDWLALPLDAVTESVARAVRTQAHHLERIRGLAGSPEIAHAREAGMKLKMGTVVTRLNINELPAIASIMRIWAPDSWKVHQFRPRGAGRINRETLTVTTEEFEDAVGAVAEAFPDVRMSPSFASQSRRAYLILNPDGHLLIPLDDHYLSFGEVVREGHVREDVWDSALASLDSNAHISNLTAGFPGQVREQSELVPFATSFRGSISPREVVDRDGA